MSKMMTRRNVLQTTTLAAASLPFLSYAATGEAETVTPMAAVPFTLVTGVQLQKIEQDLLAKPGNNNVYPLGVLPFLITVTTEVKKSGTEFEFHEDHDHIFQILEGTTVYEVGGTPKNARNTKPHEWMAPDSEGFTKLVLVKGDVLVIPRGTPHRRKTEESVTLMMISPGGALNKV